MLIMPLMFGFFSLSFASGLSIYFIASNLIGIGQYGLTGRLNINVGRLIGRKSKQAAPATGPTTDTPAAPTPSAPAPRPKREVTPVAAPAVASEPKLKRQRGVGGRKKGSGIYDSRASRARAKGKAKG